MHRWGGEVRSDLALLKNEISLHDSLVSTHLNPSLRSSEKAALLKGNWYYKLEITIKTS